ncbi:hypothetical protein [Methyloglobulus sp.]|uniref:hypothetical protein n=1 Tax=Methyloglobulus sp. TaxID=2518622 RepID=UPI0032B75F05
MDRRRKALSVVLGQSWGKYSRLRFKETTPAQCRPKNQLPLYAGIRIRVDPYKAVKALSGITVMSPYVLAIGTQIKNRPDGGS